MSRRLTRRRVVIGSLVVVAVGLVFGVMASSDGSTQAAAFERRTRTIGGLELVVTPTRVDDAGATFRVVFDTHTGAPEIDVAANADFFVDGSAWATPVWSGDGPGGHHRSGTLRFSPGGPARGTARLVIAGLEQPVEMTWQLDE
jgi:hypothetical protein